jgi:hypothetical protein
MAGDSTAERLIERPCEAGEAMMAGRGENDTAGLVDDVETRISVDPILVHHLERWVDELLDNRKGIS